MITNALPPFYGSQCIYKTETQQHQVRYET